MLKPIAKITFIGFMWNMNIQTNYDNHFNKWNKCPGFKGAVSPKFVNYVNELRSDCLQTVPANRANFINNVCDNILNRVQRVMKNCFPDTYVLTIDTERFRNKKQDVIIMDNSGVLKEHIPGGIHCGLLLKKEFGSPIRRLIYLKGLIYGTICESYAFGDGYAKSLIPVISAPYNPEFADLIKWWQHNINLLRAESPRNYQFMKCEKYCEEYLSQAK